MGLNRQPYSNVVQPVASVRDYLESLKWDGASRIRAFAKMISGDEGDEPKWREFFISAVARALSPGCQVDRSLVLVGDPGVGSSTLLQDLVGDEWLNISSEPIEDVRFIHGMGAWVVEIPISADQQSSDGQKAFLISTHDVYRPSYVKQVESMPRSFVVVLTTNDMHGFDSVKSLRRCNPVHVKHVDRDAVLTDRNQLWAEAVEMFRRGVPWWEVDYRYDSDVE